MSYQTLEVERDGPIRRVWLDRAERRNAISVKMLSEIGDVFESFTTPLGNSKLCDWPE